MVKLGSPNVLKLAYTARTMPVQMGFALVLLLVGASGGATPAKSASVGRTSQKAQTKSDSLWGAILPGHLSRGKTDGGVAHS